MAVINILKDGTIVDDMSKITVPKEIVENVARVIERREHEKKMEDKTA
jgi:hypothetical protein